MSRVSSWKAMIERTVTTGSRWILVLAGVALVAAIALALIIPRTDGGLLGGAGAATPVALSLTRDPTPIALGTYLRQHRGMSDTTRPLFVPNRTGGQSGQIVTFTVTNLDPDAAERCRLHWSELDRDRRHQPAAESFWRYEDVLGWPDGLLPQPSSEATLIDGELWIPLPNPYVDTGWFFIRVRLLCADREVATSDTGAFRVDRAPANVSGGGSLPVPPLPP